MTRFHVVSRGQTDPVSVEADDYKVMHAGHVLFYRTNEVAQTVDPVMLVNSNSFDLIIKAEDHDTPGSN